MTIDKAIEFSKEQSEIFGGDMGEFLDNCTEWLEELKLLRQENGCDKCEGMQWDALYHSEIEGYNKALDNCEKIIVNAYDNGYIDGFSLSIISTNFQQLRK